MEKKEITIIIYRGIVQQVRDIPPDIRLKVVDADTEGVDQDILEEFEGEDCLISYWEED